MGGHAANRRAVGATRGNRFQVSDGITTGLKILERTQYYLFAKETASALNLSVLKHRADVLNLSDLLTDGDSCALPGTIADDANEFLDGLEGYARTVRRKERPRILEAASFLREVYSL